jgi:hypothetical protein
VAALVNIILLFTFAASGQNQALKTAIDGYINRRNNGGPVRAKLRDLAVRVENLENRMLPIVFTYSRLGPSIEQRFSELAALESRLNEPAAFINPFTDQDWAKSSRKETAFVCCEIRRNPKMAAEIQENLAAGKPPLSEVTARLAVSRARAYAEGRSVLGDGAGSKVAPVPSRSNTRSQRPGLSTGIISGLPLPSPPAPAPMPAAGGAGGAGGAGAGGAAPAVGAAPVAAPGSAAAPGSTPGSTPAPGSKTSP